MAFVDTAFEKRRAQILGKTPGGSTTTSTQSGSSFSDPVFEQRRKKIMSESRGKGTQPIKKISTTPIQVNKPAQPSALNQLGQRITSNAQWVGQQVNQNIGEPLRKISKDVTLKIVQPTVKNITKSLPEPIQQTIQQNTPQVVQQPISITPGQNKLTQQQLTKIAPQIAQQKTPQVVQQKVAGQSATMKAGSTYQNDVARNFLSNISEQFSKEYPGSAQIIQSLTQDPLSFKADMKKTVGSVADALISPWITAYKAQIETYKPSTGIAQTTARDLAVVKSKADILFSPASAFFAGIDNVPIVASLAKIISLPIIFAGESAPQITNRLIDKLPISDTAKKELKPAVGDVFGLALQIATGHFMTKAMSKPASVIKKYGVEAFRSATKIITENSDNATVVYNLSPTDVKNVATIGGKPFETKLITDLNLSKEAWKEATQRGLSIEVTPDQLIGVIDKPYWAKIKSFFKIKPTDTTEVIPGSSKVRGGFAGYLTDGEQTPQQVAGEIIKNNLQNTPEGKAVMQTVAEAQKAGQNIVVEKKTPTLAEVKARTEQLKAQNKAKGVVGTGDQAEINAGWKPGQKTQFDLALDNKNVEVVKKLLPDVPEYYRAQVADTISKVIGKPKIELPLAIPKTISQLENIKPNAVIKVDTQPLYRGTNVDGQALVEKADKTWEKVLEIESNQAELIRQLADAGNEDAMKLIENSPNPEKVEFVQADPIIQKAIGEDFDAIKYKNDTPALKAQGETYYDLATGQSFAQLEETARMYARSSARKVKYTPPKEPVVQEKAVQIKDEAPSVISYIDKQGNKVYTKLTQAEYEILKDEVKNIPDAPQGESQIHLDVMKENLTRQAREVTRSTFIKGHSQAKQVLEKTKSMGNRYINQSANNIESAKKYIDWVSSIGNKAQGEKNGRNLMEIENSDLALPELKKKLEIAIEGKEDQWLVDLIKEDIQTREDVSKLDDQEMERRSEAEAQVPEKPTYTRGDIGKIQAQIDEILGVDPGITNFRERQRIFQQNYSITVQASDAGFPQAQDDLLKIANLTAELERLRGIKNAKKAPTGAGFADVGGYSDVESSKKALENLKAIEFPELTRMVTALMGEAPTLKFFKRALGKFYANPLNPEMKLNPEIFSDVRLATRVIAHELGHLIDFLPDNDIKRGNILGRIATLKKYMGNFISEEPGGADTITPEDRARLRKEAERLSKIPVDVETEIIIGENKATPEQVLAIWNDTNAPEKYPELLDYIQSLSASQKIEIVKEAMKNLLPTWMEFKVYSKERVITQVLQDAPEDIKKRYEELIKQEIEKRQLFSNQEIRAELKALSMLWKPFDPTANEAFTKYRYSSVELYADALSVLFNDPDLLKEKAPQFYKGFFNYLDNKPEVKQIYTDMQILLEKGEDAVNDARLASIYEGFEEGKTKRTEIENKVQPKKSWMERLMFNHITKFHPIYKILNKKTGSSPESNNQKVREALEEWQLRHQDQHEFARAVADDIVMPLNKIGLTEQDLGVVLKLEREALGDRLNLANPGGIIGADIPKEMLDRFYKNKNMTEAQIKVFEQIKKRFHDLVFAEAERASLNGNYDPVVFEEKIRPNKDTYATFGVIEYIDKNYISAGIKKQVGTLKDIENPLVSTILKTMSLIEWNNTQEAKLVATQSLLDDSPEDITEARPIKDSSGKTIKFKKEENREVLELMRMGKRIGYNVDPYIKRMFDDKSMTPSELHALVGVTRSFNRVFKPIVTTYKPGWAFWSNIVRDQKRTYINLGSALNKFAKGKRGLSMGELLASYVTSIPEGYRFVREERTALIKEMLENKALSTPWISYDPYANNDGDIGFILRKYKVLGKEEPVHIVRKIFNKSFGRFLEALQFAGSVGEATSKISGYKIAKRRGIEGKRLGFMTRNYVGTPNYMEGGAWKQIDNDVFVFSNIMLQATRVSAELATDPQTRSGYWWRTFKFGILPKLLMAGAVAGLFGEKVKDAYEKMTEYDKTNYITIPVGFDENRKAVYLRIPMDETERFLGALAWKIASSAVQGKIIKPEQVASLGAGYLPSLTPLFDIVGGWTGYAQGRNPYDSFRGRLAIDDLSWKAGGMTRLKKMVMYTLNQAGVANFKTYDTSNMSTTETAVQNIPIINRMFQVSDYGLSEKYSTNTDQEQAQKTLRKNELVNKYVEKGREVKTDAELSKVRTELIKEYFGGKLPTEKDDITEAKAISKKFMIQREKGSSTYLDKLIYSNLNAEKLDYLLQFQKDLPKSEFKALVNDALKYKIISAEVLRELKARDSQNK